jgi:hypothetical protein
MPQYDDMKPKLKRNKSAITVCLGVVLMAHALNVGGPRVKSQSETGYRGIICVPQSTNASALEHTMIRRINLLIIIT